MFIGEIQPRRFPCPYVSELTTTPRLGRKNTWPKNRLPSYIFYLLIAPYIDPVRLRATHRTAPTMGKIDEGQKWVAAMRKAVRSALVLAEGRKRPPFVADPRIRETGHSPMYPRWHLLATDCGTA